MTEYSCPVDECDRTGSEKEIRGHVKGKKDEKHDYQKVKDEIEPVEALEEPVEPVESEDSTEESSDGDPAEHSDRPVETEEEDESTDSDQTEHSDEPVEMVTQDELEQQREQVTGPDHSDEALEEPVESGSDESEDGDPTEHSDEPVESGGGIPLPVSKTTLAVGVVVVAMVILLASYYSSGDPSATVDDVEADQSGGPSEGQSGGQSDGGTVADEDVDLIED